jgi:hypothetical protein
VGRHHYAPRFYLRRWTIDGLLWSYVRNPSSQMVIERRKSPSAIGFEHDLYAVEPDPFTNESSRTLEDRLGDHENAAALVLEKMITAGLAALSIDEKRTWSSSRLGSCSSAPLLRGHSS